MKILIATPIYLPEIGGPATYTKELCERLHHKHDLTVVAYTDAQMPIHGTELVAISKQQPLPIRLIRYFSQVWKIAKKVDLIYVQNAMAAGLPVAIAAKLRGKPFIVKFVGDEAWERASQQHLTAKRLEAFLRQPEGGLKIRLMMLIQGFVLRQARVVTTPSKYLGEEIKRAYKIKASNEVVNYNAAEETTKLPFKTSPQKHQLITTARLVAWKGIDGIIKAVALLKEKFPDLKLTVAGDGPEMDNLKELIKKLGLSKMVKLLGRVSRAETWQLRKSSEIYILNSTYEGLPHTVLTSFAAGIPIIATNTAGTNEAVYDNQTGLLVPTDDPKALATAIEKLLNDKALQQKLVAGGNQMLKEKFSWKNHLETLESIFQTAVSKPVH